MNLSHFAGKTAPSSTLLNIPKLIAAYYIQSPDHYMA